MWSYRNCFSRARTASYPGYCTPLPTAPRQHLGHMRTIYCKFTGWYNNDRHQDSSGKDSLFLSQMPKAMEYIDDIPDSSRSLFYFGSQVNTSHGHMLKCTLGHGCFPPNLRTFQGIKTIRNNQKMQRQTGLQGKSCVDFAGQNSAKHWAEQARFHPNSFLRENRKKPTSMECFTKDLV